MHTSITWRKLKTMAVFTSLHAKFWWRREHARGAPNRINHIPATDSVNVISVRPYGCVKTMENLFYDSLNAAIWSNKPVLGPILCRLQICFGHRPVYNAIDPLWRQVGPWVGPTKLRLSTTILSSDFSYRLRKWDKFENRANS